MTSFDVVYTAFLSSILEDDWTGWTETEIKADIFTFLQKAIARFKFPRVSLDYTSEGFTDTLTNDEVQILACFMKCEWLSRTLLRWDNVKPLYVERDFSQANFLDKLNATLELTEKQAAKLESKYYRSIKHRPFNYGALATSIPDNND